MADTPEPSVGPITKALSTQAGLKLLKESILTHEEMEHASDRLCAIVTASWLEGRLQRAISWRLADPSYQRGIFKDGMLSAYEPKVQLGYLIRVYGAEALQ